MRFLQLEPAEYGMYWKIDPMLMQHCVDPSIPVSSMVDQMAYSMAHCLTTIRCIPTGEFVILHKKPREGGARDPYEMETFGCKAWARWKRSNNLPAEMALLTELFRRRLGLKAKGVCLDSPPSREVYGNYEDDDE